MIEDIRKNIDTEMAMLRELSSYSRREEFARESEKKLLNDTIESLKRSMKILNNSIPNLLQNTAVVRKMPGSIKQQKFENVRFERLDRQIEVTIPERDRERFLEELSISENLIKKLKRRKIEADEDIQEFQAARGYLKLSNRFFLSSATDSVNKGRFKQLSVELKKANIEILFETYVAMVFFTVFLSIFFGIFLTIFLTFFKVGLIWPFVQFYEGNLIIRALKMGWLILAIPATTFSFLYFYPNLEKKSIEKRIDGELPFAVIHMGAIAGSGISPVEIFKIIGLSKEYPYLRKEIRKVLNQINLYGYDLITSLTNASKSSPSEKLSELFSGLSTTIHSGGELKVFFEKRGESLLLTYRLEREKYSKIAETFMDIYISVVIAAPMILMILLIMMSVSGLGISLSTGMISFIMILGISLINIVFLVFLNLKQPTT